MHFKHYLYGTKFTVKTDHRPLVYLFGMKNPSSKLTRMRLDLEEFDFTVEFVKAKQNVVADALSRIKITSDEIKSINVITRSMNKPVISDNVLGNTSESDQLKMFHALAYDEVKDLPKLEASVKRNENTIELIGKS